MPVLNAVTKKIAKILDVSLPDVEHIMDDMSVTDLSGMITAAQHDDEVQVLVIYHKYQKPSPDENTPDAQAVNEFYYDRLFDEQHEQQALSATAEHFGIDEQDAADMIQPSAPDQAVELAHRKVKALSSGKKHAGRQKIAELNAWQRRMMYGTIPQHTSKIIESIVTANPSTLRSKARSLAGWHAPRGSQIAITDIMESLIEDALVDKHAICASCHEFPCICKSHMITSSKNKSSKSRACMSGMCWHGAHAE